MRRSSLVTLIVALAIIALVAIFFAANRSGNTVTPSPSPSATPSPTSAASASPSTSPSAAATQTMDYTSTGFSPATITVASGGKLAFKNSSSQTIQVDSNPHPQHTDNTELNIGTLSPGASSTVTLTKTGTWKIHNHLDPSMQATVIVQ